MQTQMEATEGLPLPTPEMSGADLFQLGLM